MVALRTLAVAKKQGLIVGPFFLDVFLTRLSAQHELRFFFNAEWYARVRLLHVPLVVLALRRHLPSKVKFDRLVNFVVINKNASLTAVQDLRVFLTYNVQLWTKFRMNNIYFLRKLIDLFQYLGK